MNIDKLSDQDLTSTLDSIALRERENTVELLRHLIEFNSRKLYRELGYPSLFEYCAGRLKLSHGSAYRRVSAARCLKDNPDLSEMLLGARSGRSLHGITVSVALWPKTAPGAARGSTFSSIIFIPSQKAG